MGAAKGKTVNLTVATSGSVGTNYNDIVNGSAFDDRLGAGNGDDVVHGGAGNDILWGDSFSNSDANDNGQDEVYGDAGRDSVHGGNGKDLVDGGADNDFVYGDNGVDDIRGGTGSDFLFGGNGDDALLGGLGNGTTMAEDVLTGGNGGDRFIFTTTSTDVVTDSIYTLGAPGTISGTGEAATWAKPWDVITDFKHLEDKIDLSDPASDSGHALIWRGAHGSDASAGANEAGLAYGVWSDTAGAFLYADIDGDGQADMKVQVSGEGEGDFVGVTYDHVLNAALSITDDDTLINDGAGDDDLCLDDLTGLVTISFGELVIGFDITDLAATGGTLSGLTNIGGGTYTATFTAAANYEGTGTVTLAAGNDVIDWSGNAATVTQTAQIDIDTKPPEIVSITSSVVGALTDSTITTTITVTFSEPVDLSTVSLGALLHGTVNILSDTTTSGTSFQFEYTADDGYDGDETIAIQNGFQDGCDNPGTGSSIVVSIDRFEDASPPPTIDHVEFVPSSDYDHNGQGIGAIGQFIAFDADGNVITGSPFTATDFGAISIAADGTLTADEQLNNEEHSFTLGLTTIHIVAGTGGGDSFDYGASTAIQIILGFGGGDAATGGLLGDTLFGGDNNPPGSFDVLIGNAGNDYLFGGDNNDKLVGGGGGDHLTGGSGIDTFIYTATGDSTLALSDLISDFDVANDKIDLSLIDANSATGGNDVFAAFTNSATVTANSVNWFTDSGHTFVQGDVTGDGIADFSIMLQGELALAAGNVTL